ncbi:MAG: SDR family NAD(P)-dependent oxidoreductase [Chloroflexi bacterium]|nr:SDR family NAD(P)-dependent oxidoreductase [Chloroflexota bacterium]
MARPVPEQVVVVTGASSGVGRAIALAFGERGARVGLIARNEEALRDVAAEIGTMGGQALVLPLDVASADQVEAAAAQIEAKWGRIDTWVNDAMVTVFSPASQMSMDEYRRVTEVNYLGYVHGTMAAVKRMKRRNEGTVIQIGSALAFRGIPLQSAYCATKGAIHLFTDSLRTELLHEGSRVQLSELVLPAVNTPQFDHSRSRMPRRAQPVPPIYQPEVIAQAVLFAATHPVRDLVIGWGALKAVIGQKVAPGALDVYLARTGYDSQMTDEPAEAGRPDNLYAPSPGRLRAHGRFDSRSKAQSLQLQLRLAAGIVTGAIWQALQRTGHTGGGMDVARAAGMEREYPELEQSGPPNPDTLEVPTRERHAEVDASFRDGSPDTSSIDVTEVTEDVYFPPTDSPVAQGMTEDGTRSTIEGGFEASSMATIDVDQPTTGGVGDEALADTIRRELRQDAATSGLRIDVSVEDGVAHLRGHVADMDDVTNVEEVAGRVPGVTEVVEELELD